MAEPAQGKKHEGMALIPDSRFMMTNWKRGLDVGEPAKRETSVKDFYMDRFEVTKGAYASFASTRYELKAKDCRTGTLLSILMRDNDIDKLKKTLESKEEGSMLVGVCIEIGLVEQRKLPSMGSDGYDKSVGAVNWFEADAYCRSVDKRLPTEVEWEKAAGGPPGGGFTEGPPNRNGYGLYDMGGVEQYEWVADMYNVSVNFFLGIGMPDDPAIDVAKVLRTADVLWFARRITTHPGNRDSHSGFRCAEDIQ